MPSEVEKLQEKVDAIQDDMENLEEKCDTLDICQEDDGCSKCKTYQKIEELNAEVEQLEEKIEAILSAEEEA